MSTRGKAKIVISSDNPCNGRCFSLSPRRIIFSRCPFFALFFSSRGVPRREYALLAVRNLCEGNLTNQASIAALQPQGHAPDTDDVLRNMGVEGRVDAQGRLRITPHSQN